jgi:hypothetical protein
MGRLMEPRSLPLAVLIRKLRPAEAAISVRRAGKFKLDDNVIGR